MVGFLEYFWNLDILNMLFQETEESFNFCVIFPSCIYNNAIFFYWKKTWRESTSGFPKILSHTPPQLK